MNYKNTYDTTLNSVEGVFRSEITNEVEHKNRSAGQIQLVGAGFNGRPSRSNCSPARSLKGDKQKSPNFASSGERFQRKNGWHWVPKTNPKAVGNSIASDSKPRAKPLNSLITDSDMYELKSFSPVTISKDSRSDFKLEEVVIVPSESVEKPQIIIDQEQPKLEAVVVENNLEEKEDIEDKEEEQVSIAVRSINDKGKGYVCGCPENVHYVFKSEGYKDEVMVSLSNYLNQTTESSFTRMILVTLLMFLLLLLLSSCVHFGLKSFRGVGLDLNHLMFIVDVGVICVLVRIFTFKQKEKFKYEKTVEVPICPMNIDHRDVTHRQTILVKASFLLDVYKILPCIPLYKRLYNLAITKPVLQIQRRFVSCRDMMNNVVSGTKESIKVIAEAKLARYASLNVSRYLAVDIQHGTKNLAMLYRDNIDAIEGLFNPLLMNFH
jgi:hypothetical protein